MSVTDKENVTSSSLNTRNIPDGGGDMASRLASMFGPEFEEEVNRRVEEKRHKQARQIAAYNLAWRAKIAGGLCSACGRECAPVEPVYLKWSYMRIQPMSIADPNRLEAHLYVPLCERCAPDSLKRQRAGDRDYVAYGDAPCGGCGRRVVWDEPACYLAPRTHIFCCRRCESRYHNRVRSESQAGAREKVCEGCGEAFTATRRDAKTCSAACKQKAYRLRKKGGAV